MVLVGLFVLVELFIARGVGQSFDPRPTDFHSFFWAAQAMDQGRDLYTSGQGAYIYPPLLAWILTPLASLHATTALRLWLVVNLAITAVSVLVLSREMSRRLGIRPDGLLTACVCTLALAANFEQIRCEFEQGQSDTIVLLGFALGLAFLDKRPWLAGIALGLAFNIKYQSLLALPYLLVRRRWSAAASMVASSTAFLFLPALTQGWSGNLRSLSIAFGGMLNKVGIGPGNDITRTANLYPIDYERSVSITSAVARLIDGAHHPERMDMLIGAVALVLLAMGWCIYRSRAIPLIAGRSTASDSVEPMNGVVAIEWVGIIVVALAFSPHTTARHTFVLLPVHVLALTILCRPKSGVKPWPLLLGTLAYTLGITLPPGGAWSGGALEIWRAIGGTTWCMLIFYFTLLWTGLRYVRAPSRDEWAVLETPRVAPA